MKKLPKELKGGLYLSYDDLPSNLKHCFLYFSLFPEDALIDRDDLVRLWLVEGFVEEQNDSLVEDVAEEYYTELLRRNLLQFSSFTLFSNAWEYKIHDLMRNFFWNDNGFSNPLFKFGSGAEILRTLFTFNGINVLNDIQLVGLEHLRVLRLKDFDINSIPDSIGHMIHLRYLNLSGTKIRALPESIGSLINLQFLDFSECIFLTTLPKSMCRLQNLRCLNLMRTPLNFIPKGISKLEKINCFHKFVVADLREPEDSYTGLEELLSSLYWLRVLRVYRLERA
ncbi:putative disease resistance protein At3g14460 [Phalaenopsis equestris]|uniref:putative disease resistance protein At3g14460 n=1 Tax=Phalaenopsis equestris TaxID=78828 RepID=UPI0009E4278F|nr:putative disease resistance protein At3g14460 [Phalaenopsis equestris]